MMRNNFLKLILLILLRVVKSAGKQNELILIGVFPIHNKNLNTKTRDNEKCGNISFPRGIQRVEAMFYAMDRINENVGVLQGIKLKSLIIDSCDQSNVAVEGFVKDALQKVRGPSEEICSADEVFEVNSDVTEDTVGGLVGAASSSVSLELANLLRLFTVPQISYASTSDLLNDRIRYKYFTRTVPPDTQQVNAMLDIAKEFGWHSFNVFYSEGIYGESAFEALQQRKNQNFCLIGNFKINDGTNYTLIHEELDRPWHDNTRLLILFLSIKHVKLFLNTFPTKHNYTILASDSWGNKNQFLKTEHLRRVAHGALTFQLRTTDTTDFVSHLQKLISKNNSRNIWYTEYLQSIGCANVTTAKNLNCVARIYDIDDKVSYVMDAVYALSYAIDEIYRKDCPAQDGVCVKMKASLGRKVMSRLYNITYPSVFGKSTLNENGSANTGYEILRHRTLGKNMRYDVVAIWNGSLSFAGEPFPYYPSFCSQPCSSNEIRVTKGDQPKCCFSCVSCGETQYRVNETTCAKCEHEFLRPNETGNGCTRIPIDHFHPGWVIGVVILSAIGIIATIGIILIFYYYKETDVVKVSAPELSFPLLFGVVLLYSLVFVLVSDQTDFLCGVRRFGVGFAYCICFSAVLIKTNRLARAFNKKYPSNRSPRFMSASSQIVILFLSISFEGGMGVMALFKDPAQRRVITDDKKLSAMYICYHPPFDIATAMGYDLILLFVSAYYAFRTRKIPAVFNEAKYLGVVTYLHVLILISFLPIYFVDVNEDILTLALSTSLFLSATSFIVVLFGPKVYIIIFRPARNARSISMRSFTMSHSHSIDQEVMHRKSTVCSSTPKIDETEE